MLTQDLLNELFEYDRETGSLTRRVPSRFDTGRRTSSRYPQVSIDGKPHRVHRIIWLLVYGHLPKGFHIDHINGDVLDNRLQNLRLASHQENLRNTKLASNSSTGFKGVSKKRDKYRAHIVVNSQQLTLGTYTYPEDAAAAYDLAAIKHFGEFARTNKAMGLL